VSNFPTGLDNLPENHVDPPASGSPEIIHAATINALADAINQLQVTLGLNVQRGSIPVGVYATVADRLAGIDTPTLKAITLPYTPVIGDLAVILNASNSAAGSITIPPNSSVPFPVGTSITVRCGGAGIVTFAAGTGVTLQSRGGILTSAGQFALVTLLKTATDFWTVAGDLA
jgi:hypothetical protein